jgi:hypothetical protein
MDAHTPDHEDDLSADERRLAAWQPAAGSLDTDAMLFEAGRAVGRGGRGRLLWPALCAFLAVQSVALAVWGLSERAERQALASRLREPAPEPGTSPTPVAVLPGPASVPAPDDYAHLRRRMEQDPSRWLAALQPTGPQSVGPPPPEPAIFRAGHSERLLEQ